MSPQLSLDLGSLPDSLDLDSYPVCFGSSSARSVVYVLSLESGKFYVGWTNQRYRLRTHFEGRGALWTKKHKPIKVLEVIKGGPDEEKQKTLEYAKKYGWHNVRGSDWCALDIKYFPNLN